MSVRSKEDVYESEDLPEVEQHVIREETNDPDNVQLIHIDIDAAKKKFAGRTLNCRNVDFSDSISKKRLAAYGSSAYVLEVVGKDYEVPETVEQKFNRLNYELNELVELVKNENVKKSDVLTESAVVELIDELKGVRVASISSQSAPIATPAKKSDVNVKSTTTSSSNDVKLLSLEQRIGRMEGLVGFSHGKQPLAEAIEDLRFRTEALNPSYIEGLETRLNSVLAKMDQVEEKREKSGDGELERKVNELLSLMEKWDSACAALPSNVKKLQALHKLHEQAQHFSERVSGLVGIRGEVEKAIAADRIAMNELQTKAKEDMAILLTKLNDLDKRTKALGK